MADSTNRRTSPSLWTTTVLSTMLISMVAFAPLAAQDPSAAGAGDSQPPTDCSQFPTYLDCFNAVYAHKEVATAAAAVKVAARATAEEITPTTSVAGASALRDYIPLFLANLGLGALDDGDGDLHFRLNPSLIDLGPNNDLAVEMTIFKPAIFGPAAQAIPEDVRPARVDSIESGLSDFDDLEIAVSYNRDSQRWGRSFDKHRSVYGTLFSELAGSTTMAKIEAQNRLTGLLSSHDVSLGDKPSELRASNESLANQIDGAILAAGTEQSGRTTALQTLAADRRLIDFSDLVDNQPQINGDLRYRNRNSMVGPDQLSVNLSYEQGWVNVNGLRKYCSKAKKLDEPSNDAIDLECFGDYLEAAGETLEPSNRVRVSIEYSESNPFRFALPDDTVDFSLGQTESIIGMLAYGLDLRPADGLLKGTRLDLQLSYEDVSGDPMKNNRFVATATFTQELLDGTHASFDIVYADKPEYLGMVDKEITTRLGLRFKLDPASAVPSSPLP